jgi:uncharacterized surface protein with fasciclin (FAS1) repeats
VHEYIARCLADLYSKTSNAMTRIALPAFLLIALVLSACSDSVSVSPTEALETQALAEAEMRGAPAPGANTIAEIVIGAASDEDEPQFTLLLDALLYTDLAGVFAGDEQYTVFAPTDEAFGDLVGAVAELLDADVLANEGPFAAIDDLLGEGTVAAVLLYHVAEGRRAANSVVPPRNNRTITTLGGGTFSVTPAAQIHAVGSSANIVIPNISASNGIIHVIDAVLLPIDLGL